MVDSFFVSNQSTICSLSDQSLTIDFIQKINCLPVCLLRLYFCLSHYIDRFTMLKMFIFKRVTTPIQRQQTTPNGQLQIVAVLPGHVLGTSTDRYSNRSKNSNT